MNKIRLVLVTTTLACTAVAQGVIFRGFAPAQTYGAGDGPRDVIVADLNGDGALDLASCHQNSNDIAVLLGNGDSTFGAATFYAAGDTPLSIAAADIDGDGDVDLTVVNGNSTSISIYRGNGDGTFASELFDFDPNQPPFPGVLVGHRMGDYDNDGDVDIAVVSLTGTAVMILPNDGSGNFGPLRVIDEPPGPGFPISLSQGDFDNDGDIDLIWATGFFLGHGPARVLLNNDDAPWAPLSFDAEADGVLYPPADFNGDGILDLAMTKTQNPDGYMLVTLGNGDGTFGPQTSYPVERPYPPTAADMDNDGNIDLVVPSFGPYHTVSVFIGHGDGTFDDPLVYAAGGNNPQAPVAIDLNGDSFLDLVTANRGGDNLSVLINLTSCTPGDLDGDGDTDVGDLGLLLGDFGNPGPNAPGDADGDGDTDIADLGYVLADFGAVCS